MRFLKVHMTRNFYQLIRKSFQNDEKWRLFYQEALLVAELLKILVYANQMTCDVTLWTQNGVK